MPETAPRYDHPRILLIDVLGDAKSTLQERGYAVATGTFGSVYKCEPSDDWVPAPSDADLPSDYVDYEIICIDTKAPPKRPWYTKPAMKPGLPVPSTMALEGRVDFRPHKMQERETGFHKVLQSGGVFVVFCSEHKRMGYSQVTFRGVASQWDGASARPGNTVRQASNISFLPPLVTEINYENESGGEMHPATRGPGRRLGNLLKKYLAGSTYECLVSDPSLLSAIGIGDSYPIILNKRDKPVGWSLKHGERNGRVILLPQLAKKTSALVDLIENYLPIIKPELFPYHQRAEWLHEPAYELPQVVAIKEEIQGIERRAQADKAVEEARILEERERHGFLHDLLTKDDRPLVLAVKKAVETLGFKKVVDVDTERKEAGLGELEDLRIEDVDPEIVIEVRGIAGKPQDEDALKADKYVATRMKDNKVAGRHTDVIALSIINHEKNKPGLQRETNPFRPLILDNTETRYLGLLTTWDLYRLARGFIENEWEHGHVRDLFYRSGQIHPVPIHYEELGSIGKPYPKRGAVTICLASRQVSKGDRVAIEMPVVFKEQDVASLQQDGQTVDKTEAGGGYALQVDLPEEDVKRLERRKLYLVRNVPPEE